MGNKNTIRVAHLGGIDAGYVIGDYAFQANRNLHVAKDSCYLF